MKLHSSTPRYLSRDRDRKVRADLACIVCFGTNDGDSARFTTLRLNPKIDGELGATLVDSAIYSWDCGGFTMSRLRRRVGRADAPKRQLGLSAALAVSAESEIKVVQQESNQGAGMSFNNRRAFMHEAFARL